MEYIIRVDDRLIHGQVVEGWIKPLKISLVVICSDSIYCDAMQKTLFSLAIPPKVSLECSPISETAENIVTKKYKNNTLILISSLVELDLLIQNVKTKNPDYIFPPINIGGLRYCSGKKQIYKALCLDNKDLELIKKFSTQNIVLEYYLLPNDNKIVLNKEIYEIEKVLNSTD